MFEHILLIVKPRLKLALPACLLTIVVLAAFLPSLKNGFTNWDDDLYVTANPAVQSISFANVRTIFSSFFIGHYQPLTMLSYLFEFHFSGLNASGYHLTNLILHVLNCLLVFGLVFLLTGKRSVAWITAVLFGIHPMQVEAVAWISERKNVLYAFFFLSAVISYLYYLNKGRALKYYYFSLILFALSLLSKSMAVTLPLVLLIVDRVRGRKIGKAMLLEKVPYFVLSLLFGIIAIFGVYVSEAVRRGEVYSAPDRLMTAAYGIIFYLGKILYPAGLSAFYPYQGTKDSFLYIFAPAMLAVLLAGIMISRRYTKKIILGSSLFLVIILPVLQFVPNGEIIVADRYVYLASVGLFYLLAEGFVWLYTKRTRYPAIVKALLCVTLAAAAAGLVSITRARCRIWKDNISLWSDVLHKHPAVATAYINRGSEYLIKKEYARAYGDFISAMRLEKDSYEPYFNLGSYYNSRGENDEAVKLLNKTLQLNSGYMKAYGLLADIYGKTGQHLEVIKISRKAIQVNPGYARAYADLCSAYGQSGNYPEAIVYGRKAIELDPRSASAHWNLAVAYFFANEKDLAVKHCDTAKALGYSVPGDFLEALKPCRKKEKSE